MPAVTDAYLKHKAEQIRKALIESGVVHSPDPDMKFADLPEDRQERWIKLAQCYIIVFH